MIVVMVKGFLCGVCLPLGLSYLESLVIRVLHSERRELVPNQGIQPIMDALDYRGLYLASCWFWKDYAYAWVSSERFKGQQVISIEDPVEIKQDNILQLQVNQAIDMTYDNWLSYHSASPPGWLLEKFWR